MSTCTRCGYNGPAVGATCPRCGQQLVQAAPLRPTLMLRLEAAGLPAREWEVGDTPMGIGRLDDSDISIPDKSVSRQHARILPSADGFDVEDLGSTNGTWLNDKQVTDRTRLSNADRLLIGDMPLRVTLRSPAPVAVAAPPPPPPLPGPPPPPLPQPGVASPVRPQPGGAGPSTVFYDIDDALAAAQPAPATRPVHPPTHAVEVATSLDITPVRQPEPPPPLVIDTRPATPPVVEQATILAPDPFTAAPPPPPPTTFEPRATAQRETTLDPRPVPPTFEPRPTPPTPSPFEPRPSPLPELQTPPPRLEASSSVDLSARTMVELADQLATALRLLKGDTRLALWLFEHAGGQAAAQTFIQQAARADAHPDDPIQQARLLSMTPMAARLLEAAVMLANVVSTLQSPDDESQPDAADLEPVTRA